MKESLLAEDIIRTTLGKWNDEDYINCERLSDTIHSPGWEVLCNLWRNLEDSIWRRIQKESDDGNDRCVLRLIGIMEGFKLAVQLHEKAFVEREEQRKITEREAKDIARKHEEWGRQEAENGA